MRSVKGHYNGQVVVLDEPAPVDTEVDVLVHFPDVMNSPGVRQKPVEFYWEQSRARVKAAPGGVSDAVVQDRDAE